MRSLQSALLRIRFRWGHYAHSAWREDQELSDFDSSRVELIDLRSDVADAAERRLLCYDFFSSVYKHAFPKLDQIETPDVWLPLINHDHPPPAPILHLIVACKPPRAERAGVVVGGIVIEYYRGSRAALATYLAVAPRERRGGLGRRLVARAIDAVAADNGGARPVVFAEVERPEAQHNDHDRRSAQARLSTIVALGGRKLDLEYVQPRLGAGQEPVEDLMLVVLAPGGQAPDSIPRATVEAFISEFFDSLGQRGTQELERVIKSLAADKISLGEFNQDDQCHRRPRRCP